MTWSRAGRDLIVNQAQKNQKLKGSSPPYRDLILLCFFVSTLAIYFVSRYGGVWGGSDTSRLTRSIEQMVAEETLIPYWNAYSQGYGYPVLSTYLVNIIAIEVPIFQLFVVPFLTVWVVFPAWLLYRELIGFARGATLATVLLFTQPEFLFVLLRSSHEKFTRGLMLLGFYLLLRSLRTKKSLGNYSALVLCFYLSFYALLTMNNLFAYSYVLVLALTLLAVWSLAALGFQNVKKPSHRVSRRFFYVLVICLIMAFVFTFYAYPPARHVILVLKTGVDKVWALFLDFQLADPHSVTRMVNPFRVVSSGWISIPTYFVFSLANWLILIGSGLIWLAWTYQLLSGRFKPDERSLLLWAFYGAFAFLEALTIVFDLTGFVGGNLQVRLFPSFGMLAVAAVAGWLVTRQVSVLPFAKAFSGVMVGSFAFLSVLSLLKATNEPTFSNNWLFSHPSEQRALLWVDEHVRSSTIWTDFNERMNVIFNITHSRIDNSNRFDGFSPSVDVQYYLMSELVESRGLRLGRSAPFKADSLRIYDNGTTKIYRRREDKSQRNIFKYP